MIFVKVLLNALLNTLLNTSAHFGLIATYVQSNVMDHLSHG